MANNPRNRENLKPFKKGYDYRRNYNGAPSDAIAARKLINEIGAEVIKEDGDITRYVEMIRKMFSSKNPKDRELLFKAIPGLLKETLEIGGDIEMSLRVVHDETPRISNPSTREIPSETDGGHQQSSKEKSNRGG